jgi:hypothetical protein
MKRLFFIVVAFLFVNNCLAQQWTEQEFEAANTARDIQSLTDEEKEVVRYINLARLYPKKFAVLEIESHKDDYSNSQVSYVNSLLSTLKNKKAVDALIFDESMYQLAKCFAIESGQSGYVGHGRKSCKKGYDAECCSYGFNTGREIVIQLIVDADVPSLGHRKICLDNSMYSIGVNIQPHAKYVHCCVLDFKRAYISESNNSHKFKFRLFKK